MSATIGIPPAITEETKMFWDGASEGRLVIEQCTVCEKYIFPPRGICSRCRSRECRPAEVEGMARVYSYTVNYQPWLPSLDVPYALVLVEFDGYDDVRIFGRLRGCGVDEIRIGMDVAIGFEPGPGGVAVPSFLYAGSAQPSDLHSTS